MKNTVVIFGGTGFVGSHLTSVFEKITEYDAVILCDIKDPYQKVSPFRSQLIGNNKKATYLYCDVKNEIDLQLHDHNIELIINCAAIHREPGHAPVEYFETNMLGAENVTKWAEVVNCQKIIFTSSISPYGDATSPKNEYSLVVPQTPYGTSKLVAEKIHENWQAKEKDTRQLIVLRPGVIYGPGEGGNVTRMIKALARGYFVFTGNKRTQKASIYILELCNIVQFLLLRNKSTGGSITLANAVSHTPPEIAHYVQEIQKILKKRQVIFNIPYSIILGTGYILTSFLSLLNIQHPFHYVRIRKLVKSNCILSTKLEELDYKYKYDLSSSLMDWKNKNPDDWKS